MSRSSIRVIFQCDGGGPDDDGDDDETSDEDSEVNDEVEGETDETTSDESEGEEEEATRAQPRSTRQSNPNLKPSVGKGGSGSKGRVTRQQTREQMPQKRLLRSRKKSPAAGSKTQTPPEIICRKCKRKFGTKQALGLHTHWCQNQKKLEEKKSPTPTPKKGRKVEGGESPREPEVKRGRGRPRKSNPLEPVATTTTTASTSKKRSQDNFEMMESSFNEEAQMDFVQGRSPESSPGLVDTSSESEYEQREFAANVHQLIQNRHSVSIDVVNPDPEQEAMPEEEYGEDVVENEEMEMQMSLPQEGPVTCPQCKMTYRTVQGFQNHWGSCMAYSSDTDEDEEVDVDVVHEDPTPRRRAEWEPVPAPPVEIAPSFRSAVPPSVEPEEVSSDSTSSEEVRETQVQQTSFQSAVGPVCPSDEIEVQMPDMAPPPPVETSVRREEPESVPVPAQTQKLMISQVPNNSPFIQPIQQPVPHPTTENVLKPEVKSAPPQLPPTPVVMTIPTLAPPPQHQHQHGPAPPLRFPQQDIAPAPVPPQAQQPQVSVQIQNISSRPPVPLIVSGTTTAPPPILQPSNNTPTYTQAQLMPGTVLHSSMTQVQPNHQMATGSGSGSTSESQPQPPYNIITSQTQPQQQPISSLPPQQFPTIVYDPVTQQHVLRFPNSTPPQPPQAPTHPPHLQQSGVYSQFQAPQMTPQMFRAQHPVQVQAPNQQQQQYPPPAPQMHVQPHPIMHTQYHPGQQHPYPTNVGPFPPHQYPQMQGQQQPSQPQVLYPPLQNSQSAPVPENSQQIPMGVDPNNPSFHPQGSAPAPAPATQTHPLQNGSHHFPYNQFPNATPPVPPKVHENLSQNHQPQPQVFNAAQNMMASMGHSGNSQVTQYIPNNLSQSQPSQNQPQQQQPQVVPYPHPLPLHLQGQQAQLIPPQNFFQNQSQQQPQLSLQQNPSLTSSVGPGTGPVPISYPGNPYQVQVPSSHPHPQLTPRPQHPQQLYGVLPQPHVVPPSHEQQQPQQQSQQPQPKEQEAPQNTSLPIPQQNPSLVNPAFQPQQQQWSKVNQNQNQCVVQPSQTEDSPPQQQQQHQQQPSQAPPQVIQQIAQYTDPAGNTNTVIIVSPAVAGAAGAGNNPLGAGVLNLIPGLQNVVQQQQQQPANLNSNSNSQCYHSSQGQGQGRSGPCPCPNCKEKLMLPTVAAAASSPLEKYKKVLPYPGTLLTSPNSEVTSQSQRSSPRPIQIRPAGSKPQKAIRIQQKPPTMFLQTQNLTPIQPQPQPQLQVSPLKMLPLAMKPDGTLQIPPPTTTTTPGGVTLERGSTSINMPLPNSNIAVVRPMENPLQKLTDQISQIESTFMTPSHPPFPPQQHPLLQSQGNGVLRPVHPSQLQHQQPYPVPSGPHLTLVTASPPPPTIHAQVGMSSPSLAASGPGHGCSSPSQSQRPVATPPIKINDGQNQSQGQPSLVLVDHGSPARLSSTPTPTPTTSALTTPTSTNPSRATTTTTAGTVRKAGIKRKLPATTGTAATAAAPIKFTLSSKEGVKDCSGINQIKGGPYTSLKFTGRVKGGQEGSPTHVVVFPCIYLVPIPVPEGENAEGNRTVEEDAETPYTLPVPRVSSTANGTSGDGKKTPRPMTHVAVVVYEFRGNDSKVIFRTADANTAWSFILDYVQGTRRNRNLPRICFPSTRICWTQFTRQEAVDMVNTKLGLMNKAVKFLVDQFPGNKSDSSELKSIQNPVPVSTTSTEEGEEELLQENESGCARSEKFMGRKHFDMFGWLTSKHRAKPVPTTNPPIETSTILNPIPVPTTSRKQKHKLMELKEKADRTLLVCSSSIHGRGLFTRRKIEEGEWVIEYAGELIRPIVCDMREKYYEFKSVGCYMFRVDDNMIIDATMRGNAARFINHSCEPNCQAKVEKISGKDRIIISALRPIQTGEELTYDYKFEKEEEKIPCTCGSKHCRKYLN